LAQYGTWLKDLFCLTGAGNFKWFISLFTFAIMRKCFPALIVATLAGSFFTARAQEKWDLRKCVDYAVANNISIKQSRIQERLSEVQYLQNKAGSLPTLNSGNSAGFQLGRSIDPVTNQFTNQQIGFVNMQLQGGISLFNWFTIKNAKEAARLTVEVNKQLTEKLKDDISLNVANAYLQALLADEQIHIAAFTVAQTKQQLGDTRKRVNAGALPELNAVQLEAQLATDSATLIIAQQNRRLNLLQLKALLFLDAAAPFDIATPPVEAIPVESFGELQPDMVYKMAIGIQPQLLANDFRLKAANKNVAAAKGSMYPTISGFGSVQTSFSSASKIPFGTPVISFAPSVAYVDVNGSSYPINTPTVKYNSFNTVGFVNQFSDNFRQSVGVSLQIPILNGRQARSAWDRAKLDRENVMLQMTSDSLTLKQNIYQAYESAVSSFQTYQSRKKAIEASQYAYDLGKKRFDIGLLPTFDLLILSTNLQRAKIDVLSAQYDYVFRMKVLEFYKGRGLKL
jgi:outer membrane protein